MVETILIILACICIILAIRGIFKWWSGINEVINNTKETNIILQKILDKMEK